jgi:hypothetical protein
MTIYFPANRGTRLGTDSRTFLYEIAICPPTAELSKNIGLTYRQGKIYLKVPFAQMSQAMRQISRLQGKILRITPLIAGAAPPPAPSAWWVEILTDRPHCLYYFGPFESAEEAQENQAGYIEDLQDEGADGIAVKILQYQPQILTQEWSD